MDLVDAGPSDDTFRFEPEQVLQPGLAGRVANRFESGKKEEGLAAAKEAVELAKNDNDKKKYQNYVKVMESRLKGPATPATPKPAAK